VEWLKVKALSTNPSTAKKKRKEKENTIINHSSWAKELDNR
jgi:hypothetical protein